MMSEMPPPPTVQFTAIAKAVTAAAREVGLPSPTFRSPPQAAGVVRTVRRRRDGGATVAVAIRDRPTAAILADCIEGVVVANRLAGAEAVRYRTALWEAMRDHPAAAA
jgi:hypothetical protein